MKVLDLGSGDGTTALPAAKLGADVVGVELEELFNRHNKGTGVTSIPAIFLRVTVAA